MPQTEPESEQIQALLRRTVRDALDSEVQRVEPIAGQLGLRRFLRVWLGGSLAPIPHAMYRPKTAARINKMVAGSNL